MIFGFSTLIFDIGLAILIFVGFVCAIAFMIALTAWAILKLLSRDDD